MRQRIILPGGIAMRQQALGRIIFAAFAAWARFCQCPAVSWDYAK